jgi:hypothetical protein
MIDHPPTGVFDGLSEVRHHRRAHGHNARQRGTPFSVSTSRTIFTKVLTGKP